MNQYTTYYTLPVPNSTSTRSPRYPALHRIRSSGHDLDIFGRTVCRCSIPKQMKFVRKVLLITLGQVLITLGLATLLVRVDPIFQWLQRSRYTWWMPLPPTFLVATLIAWQLWMRYYRLSSTTRTIMLVSFSLMQASIISDIVSKLFYNEGILVLLMTMIGLFGILLFTLQTQLAFSGIGPIATSTITIYMSLPWLRSIFDMDTWMLLWPMLLAATICIYCILELYYIMGNVTIEDVTLANVALFIDAIYPMRCLHNICELTDRVQIFPDVLDPGPHR
ncbi:hypothetical protein O0I10_005491 [Lichtheimia ornata]|uniref:Uncharacterized protein n=1 Tax=Lichtheimia ornata TaxID=688661 RepID=A0AAD7V4P5_9FUNG|nr:uncharacterized protein O0I10_005491 [Lichtheimia ornata]KAJ8658765.1 hypothetical protein O0I10_005491 [Lichtheimia ornata]